MHAASTCVYALHPNARAHHTYFTLGWCLMPVYMQLKITGLTSAVCKVNTFSIDL